jgi:hypothetical protein
MAMRADEMELRRLGEGGEHPSSLEARAGVFLDDARPATGLRDAEIAAILRRGFRRERVRPQVRLLPVVLALAVLLVTGTVMAVVSGWRPHFPSSSDTDAPSSEAQPARSKPRAKVAVTRLPSPAIESEPGAEPAPPSTPPSRPQPRRVAHVETAPSPEPPALAEGALSVEARSLANALERWRRDGKAESALALLDAHDRRFSGGALRVESRVARAEILLALSRKEQALAVLDGLSLAGLPRSRELSTLRGELRAQAGRCPEARADLARVLTSTKTDDLGKRAIRAMSSCP